jgi:hypothetical protein
VRHCHLIGVFKERSNLGCSKYHCCRTKVVGFNKGKRIRFFPLRSEKRGCSFRQKDPV